MGYGIEVLQFVIINTDNRSVGFGCVVMDSSLHYRVSRFKVIVERIGHPVVSWLFCRQHCQPVSRLACFVCNGLWCVCKKRFV